MSERRKSFVLYDPIEVYAGKRSEPRSLEQNKEIISRLEERLADLNLIMH